MYRQDLTLATPWMNASGMLGFTPSAAATARWPLLERMGAFVTNAISLGPRTPAAERCQIAYPGGALIHSGLPNPGLSRVLRKYGERWALANLPVWAHLIGSNPDEIHQMVQRLENREGVTAIELGLPPETRGDTALAFVEAALGELPLVLHLPLTAASEPWLHEAAGLGASAITLGAPRGVLPNDAGRLVSGRLYGPGIFPLMMAAVRDARRLGIPVIAGAGVYRKEDAQALRDAGAWAIQLDTAIWRGWVG